MFLYMRVLGFAALMMTGCGDESPNGQAAAPPSPKTTMSSRQNDAITFLKHDDTYIYISFCNKTDVPVKFTCFDGARGGRRIRNPDFEVFIDNKWKPLELMYCGTGAEERDKVTIKPQQSEKFTISVSSLKKRYPTPLTLTLILRDGKEEFVSEPYVLKK